MLALVDVNNFYASCERVFNPKLQGKPVIVLSNNDGCAISRNDEAKALGIEMGAPAFMMKDLIKKHNVQVFSSNYTLYGDMSDRVMTTLATFVPKIEVYSIDEAFLDMTELKYQDLQELGKTIRKTVKQHTGLPVSIGIAPTKALAKIANRFAKKTKKDVGVHYLSDQQKIDEVLTFTEIGDIWGVGAQHKKLLLKNNIRTAADFVKAGEDWVRQKMTVVGLRLLHELRGDSVIQWEEKALPKKNICTARGFGKLLTNKNEIKEALTTYASICAGKLRAQNTCATKIHVFVQTNGHRLQDEQYFRSITMQLPVATNATPEILKYAIKAFDMIFLPGLNYQKCGVIVLDLIPASQIQMGMFDTVQREKSTTLMSALDNVNNTFGKDVVRYACQGYTKRWKLRQERLSPCYTTRIEDLLRTKD